MMFSGDNRRNRRVKKNRTTVSWKETVGSQQVTGHNYLEEIH